MLSAAGAGWMAAAAAAYIRLAFECSVVCVLAIASALTRMAQLRRVGVI
jgi:hypothetical protein